MGRKSKLLTKAAAFLLLFTGAFIPGSDLVYYEAGTVWTGTGKTFSPGAILVRDGKIIHVGDPLKLSKKAEKHIMPRAFILPPFIDAQTTIGIEDQSQDNELLKAVYPEFNISDSLNNRVVKARMLFEEGVLGIYVSPGPRALVGGMGALIDIGRRRVNKGFLTMSISQAALYSDHKPTSLSGLGELLRQKVPAIVSGRKVVRIYANRPNEVEMACEFASRSKVEAVLLGVERPDLLADLKYCSNVIVIPKPTVEPDKLKRIAEASKKGVRFAFASWSKDVWHVNVRFLASLACYYGMPREAVLKGLTVNGAEACNSASPGKIEEGINANFAVYGGDPLDLSTPLFMLVAEGKTQYTISKGVKS